MNGAHALIRTLVASGVDVCFANPGTSEMHFVAALDDVPEMRAVLALFEGVATGAADGYGRMADRPAATLLHLGPGLGNGIANLHNARRARTPIVNIVGDHATYHRAFDAPLHVRHRHARPQRLGLDPRHDAAARSSRATRPTRSPRRRRRPGGSRRSSSRPTRPGSKPASPRRAIAPVARRDGSGRHRSTSSPRRCVRVSRPRCCSVARRCASAALLAASRVAQATGRQAAERDVPGPARARRGAARRSNGSATSPSSRWRSSTACATSCSSTRTPPVSFFAYPDKPSMLVPDGCEVHVLAAGADDVAARARAPRRRARRATPTARRSQPAARPERADGRARRGAAVARGARRAAARGRDRRRRGADERAVRARRDRGCAAPRLADAHRWRDRPGHAARDRCRGRVPGSQGAVTSQADGSAMYTLQVAVDAGA